MKKKEGDLVRRWEGNPTLSLDNIPFTSNNIFSAGAVFFERHYLLLVTIENLEGKTNLYLAKSKDGYHFEIHNQPFLKGTPSPYEALGIQESRITRIEDHYYICYLGKSRHGTVLCLARTKDFNSVERMGIVSEPDTRAGALFPRKFKGRYARFELPESTGSIWMSFSKDLTAWGDHQTILLPRKDFWDSDQVGCACPPLAIADGWLLIYYGLKKTSGGWITRLGGAILDGENPQKVVSRSNIPFLSPRKDYERVGDFQNVVFSTGAVLEKTGQLILYYAAADNCLCVGTVPLEQILKSCYESKKEY